MGSVNRTFIVGNLGRDAELRYTGGGTPVANFSIATSESWTDKQSGERREQTEWHRICLWGPSAEKLQEYLVKGKQVCVEGRLQTRQWEDRDGNKRYTTEIRADRVTLLGRRGDTDGQTERGPGAGNGQERYGNAAPADTGGGGGSGGGGGDAGQGHGPDLTEDDIPF